MRPRNILPLAVFGLTASAVAQDGFPISTDRPSFSDGTGIIPKGRWQLETGFTFNKVGEAELQTIGEVLLRFPLQERLELRFSNFGLGHTNGVGGGGEGFLDPVAGVKYRLQTGVSGKTPDLAFVAQATIPAGSPDFRVRRSQPTLKLAGYHQLDAANGAGWNVVWSNLGPRGATFDQWAISGYWACTLDAKTASFVELYHLMPASKGGPNSTFVDAGVTYLLDKATQIDLRIGSGLDQRRDGWFIGAGVAFRF